MRPTFWSVDSLKQNDEWLALFDESIRFMSEMRLHHHPHRFGCAAHIAGRLEI